MASNFAWTFAGSTLYNLSQWFLLIVLARLASSPENGVSLVGEWSLLLAIAAPIFMTIGLNLRTLQATDTNHQWMLPEYLRLRWLLNASAIVVTLIVGLLLNASWATYAALGILALAKSIEALSQTYYGFFQLHERLDLVARSMISRAALGPLLFGLGYALTETLALAAVGLATGWLVVQLAIDRPNVAMLAKSEGYNWSSKIVGRRIAVMARRATPLGLDQGISSISINIPRYVLEGVGGSAQLGVYAGQSYVAQLVSVIAEAMSTVLLPRLARTYHNGKRKQFCHILLALLTFGLVITVVATLGAYYLGDYLLRLTLGSAFVDRDLLISLVIAAGVITLQRSFSKALEASHKFTSYAMVDVITALVILTTSYPLIVRYGPVGAALASSIGFFVGALLIAFLLWRTVRHMPNDEQEHP